jgi:putative CocE/NonD family hydrolase
MTAPREYRACVERNVPATMRDGTLLYADVWRPDVPGRFPVVMSRTPYDKSQPRNAQLAGLDPMRAVGEGYVVIYQDVRGRFTSGGEWSFEAEFDDGYDSVEWAASLPHSDGNVGMFGISYLGLAQWMAAAARPPHLKAIFPQQIGNGWEDNRAGGAFHYGAMFMWATLMAPDFLMRRALSGADVRMSAVALMQILNGMPDAYERLPLSGGHPVVSELFPAYDRWLEQVENDDFWQRISWAHRLKEIDVPVFSLGGWHDIVSGGVTGLFAGMCRDAPSEQSRRSQKLIMGPWTHGQMASDVISDVYMGLAATSAFIDLPGLHLRWFDHWLKGKDTGLMKEPPVRIFVMGDNAWRNENEWPLARTQWTNYYLHSGGRANTREGDGSLYTSAPSAAEPVDRYLYDPRSPVPTTGGPVLLPGVIIGANAGPKDQTRVECRADVLVYSTPPLEQAIEVTGPITATIFAATSAPDTDWTVKLVDVYPDGRAYGLTDGIVRARYRNGPGRPELLEPGTVYKYEVNLQVTSSVFKKGHRIRVQVSSSNFPTYSRNPNTGRRIATETELVPALQTILHDAEHPSHIRLPIIPR